MATASLNSSIKLLVVDDHPMIRAGVAALVARERDMQIVAEAQDGEDAVRQFERHRPDVTLLDLQMPRMGGMEALAEIRRRDAAARVIVLTTYRGDMQARRALEGGAQGYLLKNAIRRELVTSVRDVAAGRRVVAPEVALELSLRITEEPLSQREMEVLEAVADGGANKRVAERLGVTEETIKSHMRSILQKLGAKDRVQAVVIAMRRGILNQDP